MKPLTLSANTIRITLLALVATCSVASTNATLLQLSGRSNFAEQRRVLLYAEPIARAMRMDDLAGVKKAWKGYSVACLREDPMLRLELARFFCRRKDYVEARGHLEKILNPGKGNASTLQSSGEVMSLWLSLSSGQPKWRVDGAMAAWENALSNRIGDSPSWDLMSTRAKIEYVAAQEFASRGNNSEALVHYKACASFAPRSSFAFRQLGLAKRRIGDATGAREAFLQSYRNASPSERGQLLRRNHLSNERTRPH